MVKHQTEERTADKPTRHPIAGLRDGGMLTALVLLLSASSAVAQQKDVNYDESRVGLYTLPEALVGSDGEKVTTAEMWKNVRRPEILRLFETYVYGKVPTPPRPITPIFRIRSEDREALGGKAVRREISILFTESPDGPRMDLLLYLPKDAGAAHRVPAFLGLNFNGNHAVNNDPGITLSTQ